jgi:hypothetical protein
MLEYVLRSSQKIGGPNKTVEIDDSKFGWSKINRGHKMKGQWVFGGVERESGKTFLVPVPDTIADTLMAVISDWIEPGTTFISGCTSTNLYYNLFVYYLKKVLIIICNALNLFSVTILNLF